MDRTSHLIDRVLLRHDHTWAKATMLACGLLLLIIDHELGYEVGWWIAAAGAALAGGGLVASLFTPSERLMTLNTIASSLVSLSLVLNTAGVLHHLSELEFAEIWRPALIIGLTNIGLGAYWYWRLDEGGPKRRAARDHHSTGAFLFPQMSVDPSSPVSVGKSNWKPHFIDYLFLSFTTSTSMAPSDTPVLSRYAKIGTMIQVVISMVMLTMVVARAISLIGAAP